MDKPDKLTLQAFAAALCGHILLILLLNQIRLPPSIGSEGLAFVDLAAFGRLDGGAAAPPPPPPPPVAPPAVRRPPPLKAARSDSAQADMAARPPAPPKPRPVPPPPTQPAPPPAPNPAPPQTAAPAAVPADNGSSSAAHPEATQAGTAGTAQGKPAGSGIGSSAANPGKASGVLARPKYPPLSLENSEEGTVVLKILVAPGGRVEKVSIIKSSGYIRLDRAAINGAAKNGRFTNNTWLEYTGTVHFFID